MTKTFLRSDIWLIFILFLLSRIIVALCNIDMDYGALYRNWQYLDMLSLREDLLKGIWYDHTQPPVFNLLLGIVLKVTGSHARIAFVVLLRLITLANTFLLLGVLRRLIPGSRLPLIISIIYLLSPAAIIFENELFYTSFITLMLLTACWSLTGLQNGASVRWRHAAGFFLPLLIVCLTRSMYHLLWCMAISALLLAWFRKKQGRGILLVCSLITIVLTGSWYLKNYLIFRTASTSTWMGMNIARNIFHDAELGDSSKIQSIEPFSRISAYSRFLPAGYADKYRGLDDKVLLEEYKNDSLINEKHAAYIEVSRLYMEAGKKEIRTHPAAYLKNVLQSAIIYFAPATRYPTTEYLSVKMGWYDLVYSFNLSHFAKGRQQRRIALTISAIPKFLVYLLVFGYIVWNFLKTRRLAKIPGGLLTIFIGCTIGYIFVVSSFFEHYENMRFRYEAEPLFMILAGLVWYEWKRRRQAQAPARD